MKLLSGHCSCCGRHRDVRLGDLLLCAACDTAENRIRTVPGRGCPPDMPGAVNGYTVAKRTDPKEQA